MKRLCAILLGVLVACSFTAAQERPERAARLVDFHARDAKYPGLAEVLDKPSRKPGARSPAPVTSPKSSAPSTPSFCTT